MSRRTLIPAADVTAVRTALGLKQFELAERLGVTRRTVIRGEQRGLEIPSTWGNSPRKAVGEAWRELRKEAARALRLQALGAKAAARRKQNRDAARRYRRKAKVTRSPRSQGRRRRPIVRKVTVSRSGKAARGRRRSDKSRKIRAKKSPRRAGRRRVRK